MTFGTITNATSPYLQSILDNKEAALQSAKEFANGVSPFAYGSIALAVNFIAESSLVTAINTYVPLAPATALGIFAGRQISKDPTKLATALASLAVGIVIGSDQNELVCLGGAFVGTLAVKGAVTLINKHREENTIHYVPVSNNVAQNPKLDKRKAEKLD